MRRLTLAEFAHLRSTPGRALGLFITDRCPVGCAHCSVSSRRDSPTITDFARFAAILDGMAVQPRVSTIAITGGEPFVERRGLTMAVDRFVAAGKDLVLFTSGIWANREVADWVRGVLRQARCVFLSTDAFHAATIDDDRFVRAARTIAAEGAWIIVQVLELPEMVQRVERLLQTAFGDGYRDHAELSLISPLPVGRGAALFAPRARHAGETFGRCGILTAPLIRYDGMVSACCNEQVIMGHGAGRLRRRCERASDVVGALEEFAADPLLRVIGGVGAGAATKHPRFADFAGREFGGICELCWAMQERAEPLGAPADRLLSAMALMGQEVVP